MTTKYEGKEKKNLPVGSGSAMHSFWMFSIHNVKSDFNQIWFIFDYNSSNDTVM